MKKNMGVTDRNIRLAIAAILLIVVILKVVTGVLAYVFLAAAVIFVITGFVRFCPLYLPFRINTNRKEES